MVIYLYYLCFFFTFFIQIESVAQESRVILITGASRGIGWETAKKLASQKHRVYASMRSPASFSNEFDLPTLQIIELDVTDDSSVAKAFEIIQSQEGRLDVLINNAGCAVFGPLEVITIEQAKKTFDVNFFGTMRLMQAALPIMREQRSGLIVNLSSTSGVRPSPGWDIYAASKFAVEGLSEALAAFVRQWNIRVALVQPGATSTDFMTLSTEIGNRHTAKTEIYSRFMPYAVQWMKERLSGGQDPEEVADVIASIVSSDRFQLRYQTSPRGTQIVAKRFCDPTGEASVQEQELLIKQLWQGFLDASIGSSYR